MFKKSDRPLGTAGLNVPHHENAQKYTLQNEPSPKEQREAQTTLEAYEEAYGNEPATKGMFWRQYSMICVVEERLASAIHDQTLKMFHTFECVLFMQALNIILTIYLIYLFLKK